MSSSPSTVKPRLPSVTNPPFQDDCQRGELYWLD